MNVVRLLAGYLLIATIASCRPGSEEPREQARTEALTIDRGDVRAAMSSVPGWPAGTGWRIEGPPLLWFGGVDDAGGVTIGNLQTAFILDAGPLVIADDQASTLSWIDPSGGPVMSVGGMGEGPGEFRFLNVVGRTAGDTIVVVDATLRRVTVISPTREIVRTEPLDPTAWQTWSRDEVRAVRASPRASLDDGTVLGVTHTTFYGSPLGVIQDSVWIVLDPPGSRPAIMFGPLPGSELWGSPGRTRGLPLGRYFTFATARSEIYAITGKAARIDVLSRDGRLVRAFGIDRALREVDGELIEKTKGRLIAVQVASQRERLAGILEEIKYPKEVPAFSHIVVDAEGNVWVEEYSVTPGPPMYDVFDPEGIWLGRVTAPDGVRILQVGRDFVLATRRDEDNVDEVLLYRLSRSE